MRDVTLPLVTPSILAGALLVFVGVAASFSVAALIGIPARVFLLSTRVVSTLHLGGANAMSEATAMSGVLMALGLGGLVFTNRLTRRGRYTTLTGKSTQPEIVRLGTWRLPILALLAVLLLVIVVLPLGAVVLTSFFRTWGLDLRPENLTLANYRYVLFRHHLTVPGLRNSLLLAAGSATIAVGVGAVLAYLKLRGGRRLGEPIDVLATLPYAIPGTVVALGLILAFSGRHGLNLYNTFGILLVAYVVKDLALGLRSTSGTLQQVHASLEEAARVSGATWWRTFRDIVLPLVRPGLVAGWFAVFIPAFRELNMTVLLYGPRTPTAGVALYELQNGGYFQSAAALAVVILVVTFGGMAAIRRITRGAAGV
jgi:iron(III) transport system permease protein